MRSLRLGALGVIFLLLQLLCVRQSFIYAANWQEKHLKALVFIWDGTISLLVVFAFFAFGLVKLYEEGKKEKEEPGKSASKLRLVHAAFAIFTFIAMFIGALLLVSTDRQSLYFVRVFPMGLLMLLPEFLRTKNQTASSLSTEIFSVAAYGIYVVLFMAIVRARKWNTFGIVCFVLAVVLLLNVAGCKKVIEGFSNIQ